MQRGWRACLGVALMVTGSTVCTAGPGGETCETAQPIGEGFTAFSTAGAASELPAPCAPMGNDIWFQHVAAQSGPINVSLCQSSFDTVLTIYEGCECPPTDDLDCNDDFCGSRSRLSIDASAGTCYLIQVGGYQGATGSGELFVASELCPGGGGDCLQNNGTPGCDDADCCSTVCDIDLFCCLSEWDTNCATFAFLNCTPCNDADGNCSLGHDTPGCNVEACCDLVCDITPACCEVVWDQSCGDAAQKQCDLCPGDANGDNFVNVGDMTTIVFQWQTAGSEGDLNGDGIVNVSDLTIVIFNWAPLGCD